MKLQLKWCGMKQFNKPKEIMLKWQSNCKYGRIRELENKSMQINYNETQVSWTSSNISHKNRNNKPFRN